MKKRLLFGFVIIGIALVLFAIFNHSPEPQNTVPIHSKITNGDLVYEFQLDKNQYRVNEEISINVKVMNIGKDTKTYLSGSSSCPSHFIVEVALDQLKKELSNYIGENCTSDLSTSKLPPNQYVEETYTFTAKELFGSFLKRGKTGTYEVRVSLPGSNPSGDDRRKSAAVQVKVY